MMKEFLKIICMPLIETATTSMKQYAEVLVVQRRLIEVIGERCDDPTLLERYDSEFTRLVDYYNNRFSTMTFEELRDYLKTKAETIENGGL